MKFRPVLLLLVAFAIAACAQRKHAHLDGWYEGSSGYELAMAEQQRTGKPVFVYFHTNWCGWCSKLERDVLSTSAFQDRFASAIKVRINPEETRANGEVATRYSVHAFPTVCVIANGRTHNPIVGYMPPDLYLSTLQAAISD